MAEERRYDLVVFGDEVPGVLAAVAAARQQRRRGRPPRVLLISPGPAAQGLGGHLVRGRLAYLDRSQIAASVRQRLGLPTFGDPPALYAELLREAGVARSPSIQSGPAPPWIGCGAMPAWTCSPLLRWWAPGGRPIGWRRLSLATVSGLLRGSSSTPP